MDSVSPSTFKTRSENFLEMMLYFREGLILGSPVSDYTRQQRFILVCKRYHIGKQRGDETWEYLSSEVSY